MNRFAVRLGCGIGLAGVGFVAWSLIGFVVGVSDDYALYKSYEPKVWPLFMVLVAGGFLVGVAIGGLVRRKRK